MIYNYKEDQLMITFGNGDSIMKQAICNIIDEEGNKHISSNALLGISSASEENKYKTGTLEDDIEDIDKKSADESQIILNFCNKEGLDSLMRNLSKINTNWMCTRFEEDLIDIREVNRLCKKDIKTFNKIQKNLKLNRNKILLSKLYNKLIDDPYFEKKGFKLELDKENKRIIIILMIDSVPFLVVSLGYDDDDFVMYFYGGEFEICRYHINMQAEFNGKIIKKQCNDYLSHAKEEYLNEHKNS